MFYGRACCECAVFSPLVAVSDVLGFLQRSFGGSQLRSAAVSGHVDQWYEEPDSKAVVLVVADAAVGVAAADADFETLREFLDSWFGIRFLQQAEERRWMAFPRTSFPRQRAEERHWMTAPGRVA